MSRSGTESCRPAGATGDEGFTLLETLVALAIFAMAFAGLHRALEGGWRSLRQAALELEATEVARNQLTAAGIETPLAVGQRHGETASGILWEVIVRRYEADAGRPDAKDAFANLYVVTARAGRRTGADTARAPVELTTMRLGDRP